MTIQNNAAQPVLTDEEINAACGRHPADTGWHAENDRKKARAVESALLSKLHAPVADKRISQLSKEVDEAIREEGAGRPFCITAGEFKGLLSKMRAALASARTAGSDGGAS